MAVPLLRVCPLSCEQGSKPEQPEPSCKGGRFAPGCTWQDVPEGAPRSEERGETPALRAETGRALPPKETHPAVIPGYPRLETSPRRKGRSRAEKKPRRCQGWQPSALAELPLRPGTSPDGAEGSLGAPVPAACPAPKIAQQLPGTLSRHQPRAVPDLDVTFEPCAAARGWGHGWGPPQSPLPRQQQ